MHGEEDGLVFEYDSLTKLAFAGTQAVEHPLGPPVVTGTTITVDIAVNQPTRITSMIMDLTLQRFIIDRVFTSAGGVTGGAVVYDVLTTNELYLSRDIRRVAPGDEFPLVTGVRRAPVVAEPEKWGGKYFMTREAIRRNDVAQFTMRTRQLGNTVVRKLNQRAIEVIEAAVTAYGQTVVGNNWNTVVTAGGSASNASAYPAYDFMNIQTLADNMELGVVIDLWIMNPAQWLRLGTIYGAYLGDLLTSMGISVFVSPRVPAGVAYALAEGQVGELRIEFPLATETQEEGAPTMRQRTWVQTSVAPVMFVNQPFSLFKVTGLAG
jgi:hypothetical protein